MCANITNSLTEGISQLLDRTARRVAERTEGDITTQIEVEVASRLPSNRRFYSTLEGAVEGFYIKSLMILQLLEDIRYVPERYKELVRPNITTAMGLYQNHDYEACMGIVKEGLDMLKPDERIGIQLVSSVELFALRQLYVSLFADVSNMRIIQLLDSRNKTT